MSDLLTVVAVSEAETTSVVERVEGALGEDRSWAVRRCGLVTPRPEERDLGTKLAHGPQT